MAQFYEFAYIDGTKLRQLVSAIDSRGQVKSIIASQVREKSKGLKGAGGLAGVVSLSGGAESTIEEATQETILPSPEADFHRLRDYLAARDDFVASSLDGVPIESLPRGAMVEISGQIEVSPANRLMSDLAQFVQLAASLGLPLRLGKPGPDIAMLARFFAMPTRMAVLMSGYSSSTKALAVLDKKFLTVSVDDLTDEYLILGKLIRVVTDQKGIDLLSYALPSQLSRFPQIAQELAERFRELPRELGTIDLEQLRLKPPALVLSPVAIYR